MKTISRRLAATVAAGMFGLGLLGAGGAAALGDTSWGGAFADSSSETSVSARPDTSWGGARLIDGGL